MTLRFLSFLSLLALSAAAPPKHGGGLKKCYVPYDKNPKVDDSPAILKTFQSCNTNSEIIFHRANYSAYTPISLTDLDNVVVRIEGNLNLPNNIGEVQKKINETLNQPSTYATPWFYFSGKNISLIGSEEFQWGRFNGFGQQWWDIGNRTLRPQLATFNVSTGLLRKLKVIKPVAWGWNLPGTNLRVEDHYVDAKPWNGTRDSTVSFPFNTDGLNLSGQNITVDGYWGENGDDCVSVINGARNIVAQNGYCGFSSHGLSIGSLGRNGSEQTVGNVLFRNWTMDGAVYGARFKSWTGGRGWAENVTWEDITLVNVSTGIFVTQNYYDQDKGPRPDNPSNSSTRVTNFAYKNFKGGLGTNWTDGTCISSPCWNYVEGGDATQVIIFDLYPGTAGNLTFQNIDVQPFDTTKNATVICDPNTLQAGEQDTLGFNCTRGPFVETSIVGDGLIGSVGRRGAAGSRRWSVSL